MATHRVIWLSVFIVMLLLAPLAPVLELDRVVSAALRPYGQQWPPLQLVWVLGGVPLTFLVLMIAAYGRVSHSKPWRGLIGGFLVGTVVEVLCKHWLAIPNPLNVPPPPAYQSLILATNIEPQQVVHWLSLILGANHQSSHHLTLLRGTFPSGHLFRLTFVLSTLITAGRWQWTVVALAAVATAAVVATGGHWIWDAAGGYCLSQLMAAWSVK